MSDPNHLRPDCDGASQDQQTVALPIRKGELPNERSPNVVRGRCQWSLKPST